MKKGRALKDIRRHKRVKDMLLGALERPALQWLCAHSPAWLTPDILTAIGLLGAALSLLGYWLSNDHPAYLWLASFGMLVNWYGDSMDGSLARYRKIERPRYGFFVDHTLYAVAQVMVFLGFALSPYVRFDVAILALNVYLLMDIQAMARTSVQGVFKITYGKIGPTEVRALVVLINTTLLYWNPIFNLPWGEFTLFDFIIIALAVSFVYIFFSEVLSVARSLRDADERALREGPQD